MRGTNLYVTICAYPLIQVAHDGKADGDREAYGRKVPRQKPREDHDAEVIDQPGLHAHAWALGEVVCVGGKGGRWVMGATAAMVASERGVRGRDRSRGGVNC